VVACCAVIRRRWDNIFLTTAHQASEFQTWAFDLSVERLLRIPHAKASCQSARVVTRQHSRRMGRAAIATFAKKESRLRLSISVKWTAPLVTHTNVMGCPVQN